MHSTIRNALNESIDAVEDADLSDEAKQQLEEAQKQLNEAAGR